MPRGRCGAHGNWGGQTHAATDSTQFYNLSILKQGSTDYVAGIRGHSFVFRGSATRTFAGMASRSASAKRLVARRRGGREAAKVEHPFLYVKRHFGYAKVRYRGVAKNRQRIALLLGFSNLLIAGRYATG